MIQYPTERSQRLKELSTEIAALQVQQVRAFPQLGQLKVECVAAIVQFLDG